MDCSKFLALVTLTIGWVLPGRAQLEGKTLQTMLDQIAELQAYASVAADGYRLVENGLHTIATIRRGEWDLHATYYGSLRAASSAVRGMPEAADLVRAAAGMVKAGRMTEATAVVGDLTALVTDGQLSMTDGERMRRIIALDAEVRKSK